MRILILGNGLIGPAIAFKCICTADVSDVILCDINSKSLKVTHNKLSTICDTKKLCCRVLNVKNSKELIENMKYCDVAISALPKNLCANIVRSVCVAKIPLVELSHPSENEKTTIYKQIEESKVLVVFGCGIEPGMTEVMSCYGAKFFDQVDELHIKCGGIPEKPKPPLEHKILFKSCELPIKEENATIVVNGKIRAVPKFSDIECVHFFSLGKLEAYHDWFMSWLLEFKSFKNLKLGTQKTVRWPGYIIKARFLKEIGMLSHQPIDINGISIVPNEILKALLLPKLQLEANEKDVTVFRIELLGKNQDTISKCTIEMMDHFDSEMGFTSMARTTGFPAAFIAMMIARGTITAQGSCTPEVLLHVDILDKLINDLRRDGIKFKITNNVVEASMKSRKIKRHTF